MAKLIFSFALILFTTGLYAQASNTFPLTGNAGIGTLAPANALQILHATGAADTAFIRLSNGGSPLSNVFGLVGLMPATYPYYSSISTGEDLIIHEHSQGDLILTNFEAGTTTHPSGAIRFATTPDSAHKPMAPSVITDLERMTINGNGNVGIDLPPDTGLFAGLGNPKEQLQIGGGATAFPGELDPTPGIAINGGNRFEGVARPGGGFFPGDWRSITFNSYIDHTDTSQNRYHRFARMASSGISFSDFEGGTLQMWAAPYDSMNATNGRMNMTLNLTGEYGLQLWSFDKDSSNPYHHELDIVPPHVLPSGITRNPNGYSYFHTPVFITSDYANSGPIDFQNLPIQPDIGDDTTFDLVVNGPVLVRELFALDSSWADYVFDPNYKLTPLADVENFIKQNHHLSGVPSAAQIARTGVPVGRTEEALTKKVEELTLYDIQLSKKNEELNSRLDTLEKKFEQLQNQKGK